MSALTGNQIKDTYQGLLKLADSSTGITQSFQAVQDGLGNDTGLRIATGQLESDNIPSFVPLKARYYGSGFNNAAGVQYSAGIQNTILATPFYDNGNYSYSAISINVGTQTSTSDTLEFAIYTSQMINPNGLYPHAPIISGLTADVSSTGVKTVSFGSNISMSGYGAGIYWLVYEISNGGVQPTFRPAPAQQTTLLNQLYFPIYGMTLGFTTNTYQVFNRYNNTQNTFQSFSGLTTFGNPFPNTINTAQSTNTGLAGAPMGFVLHTVDA
ncbi:hypothetical protein UFOVP424_27 [uncultured Caudovirales phage]|uniref:Uncharacterized protein n=1 Tax=uncultured Caudovirales phage TaxID=2100421 RepID=A0A6J5M415_9CAUD|nr:hypothetical protein UFOVP424_27 [uncultured Caudovirales phage]